MRGQAVVRQDAPRPRLVSVANMAMRGASLAGRFGLSIYLARMLGYQALGTFGLLSGCAGILPAALGCGVSYHVNREILETRRPAALCLLRDRLVMSCVLAVLLWLPGLGLIMAGIVPANRALWLGGTIVTMEIVAFDLHIGLINLRQPVTANFLLFVRSASWIAPVTIGGVLIPALRHFDMVLLCWLGALVVNFGLLPLLLPDLVPALSAGAPIDWRRLRRWAGASRLIWLNDLANVSQTFVDRFVVAQMLGVAAAGVYTLYFSVTQGIYVLIATAVTQLSMPKLVAARDSGGRHAWARTMRSEAIHAIATAAMVMPVVLILTVGVLPALGFANFTVFPWFFAAMTATALLKPLADLANTGLYSLRADRTLALTNLGAAALGFIGSIPAVQCFGLIGIALCAMAVQAGLIMARGVFLMRLEQRL